MAIGLAVVVAREYVAVLDVVFTVGVTLALVICAMIDARTRTIPNRIVYATLAFTFLVTLVHPERTLMSALVGAIVAATPFLMAFWFVPWRVDRASEARVHEEFSVVPSLLWAGIAGAIAMLLVGLGQANQSATAAVAGAVVAGAAFGSLICRDDRRCGVPDASAEYSKPARGMGGGDVKLAALLGSVAGMPTLLSALAVAVIGGSVAAIALVFIRKGRHGDGSLPYGPFLAGGAVLAVFGA